MLIFNREIEVDVEGRIVHAYTFFDDVARGGTPISNDAPPNKILLKDYWWDGSGVALRPAMIVTIDKTNVLADGIDSCTLTNLPDPCEISITGDGVALKETVVGGSEIITFDTPGKYTVKVTAFPAFDKEFLIDAT